MKELRWDDEQVLEQKNGPGGAAQFDQPLIGEPNNDLPSLVK